jgi:hypothetical protein
MSYLLVTLLGLALWRIRPGQRGCRRKWRW